MIQTYQPITAMIICKSGGEYVLYSDHLKVIAMMDKVILELTCRVNLMITERGEDRSEE